MTALPNDLTLLDRCVASALERLADEAQRSTTETPDAAERAFFKRWSGCYRRALYQYLTGVKPRQTPSGAWLVPSGTRAGVIHHVSRDGHCTCEAGEKNTASRPEPPSPSSPCRERR